MKIINKIKSWLGIGKPVIGAKITTNNPVEDFKSGRPRVRRRLVLDSFGIPAIEITDGYENNRPATISLFDRAYGQVHVGEILRLYFDKKGKDKSLADWAREINISRPNLSRIINGHQGFSKATAEKIAFVLIRPKEGLWLTDWLMDYQSRYQFLIGTTRKVKK